MPEQHITTVFEEIPLLQTDDRQATTRWEILAPVLSPAFPMRKGTPTRVFMDFDVTINVTPRIMWTGNRQRVVVRASNFHSSSIYTGGIDDPTDESSQGGNTSDAYDVWPQNSWLDGNTPTRVTPMQIGFFNEPQGTTRDYDVLLNQSIPTDAGDPDAEWMLRLGFALWFRPWYPGLHFPHGATSEERTAIIEAMNEKATLTFDAPPVASVKLVTTFDYEPNIAPEPPKRQTPPLPFAVILAGLRAGKSYTTILHEWKAAH